ncbi:C-type lectin mannose-binding isoform-like [Uranotaenia lowii]|uniref:C-type lectin mannose-binding isoform-like n=1 Tax=Uranotaenia lowii TaxID=190385 RepID=UPI00247875F1|nr:C-type lectin mannose-binding isoform-like [Uranotaenia lowii]
MFCAFWCGSIFSKECIRSPVTISEVGEHLQVSNTVIFNRILFPVSFVQIYRPVGRPLLINAMFHYRIAAVAIAVFTVLASKNVRSEILGNQTVQEILSANQCLCPCNTLSGAFKSFTIPFKEANWFEAYAHCAENGKALVQIRDSYDRKDLQDWLKSYGYGSAESYWIGANDLATQGLYRWGLTSKRVNDPEWAFGEPNSAVIRGEIERCVQLNARTMSWNDALCSKRAKFICEEYTDEL